MKLSSFSVILTFVILMIVGAALLPLVDVGTEPQNQRDNRLVIRCEWPQVSAKIVEQNLTTPIEGMVSALKGVERVSSRSSYGSSEIVVWAKEKVDVAALRFSVTSLLRQSYAKLPKGAGYPVVEGGEVTGGARMHQEQQLLLTYQVNGDMPPEMLKKLVSGNVVRRLQLLDGVDRVEVAGTTDKYVEVSYDPMALAVNAMYAAPDGTLWVGTVEGGLNSLAPGGKSFTHYTVANSGLPHNSVSTLAADNRGNLWIGTWGAGFAVMNLKQPGKITPLVVDGRFQRLLLFAGAMAYDPINDGM